MPRIGFNPQDKFMLAVGQTLVVVTETGDVFGADIVNRNLEPVFKFSGAKIGYNPQDKFMVAMGNTLMVITQDGSVFGAEVVGRDIQPVFPFTGAKIGYNPWDRFMLALGNTLVVITQDGSAFGAEVVGRDVRPVVPFTGAKIGYNPQDRCMVAMGNTLMVVTQDGSVFGADVTRPRFQDRLWGQEVGAVFQLTGARIGFSPQDRFMVAMGNALIVIRQDGDVFAADVMNRDVRPVFQVNALPPSVTLEAPSITSGLSIGGHAKLVIQRDGQCTFSGHMHNSGGLGIDYLLTFVGLSPAGIAVADQHKGHTAGTFTSGSRDDDWVTPKFIEHTKEDWEEITRARLVWTLNANDTLTGQLGEALENALQKAIETFAVESVRKLFKAGGGSNQ